MWHKVCELNQLNAYLGTGAIVDDQQVALFYLPSEKNKRLNKCLRLIIGIRLVKPLY